MKNRILVFGYHGFRNAGAECRVIAMLDQLRRLAPGAEIVVNALHRTNLSYLQELDYLKGIELRYFHPATYRVATRRLIADSDVVISSEGNMLTEAFSKHMVTAFVSALEQAHSLGVPSVGLALDTGTLSPRREARAVEALNTTALLTVRAPGAAAQLERMGVRVPIAVTADCAVSMRLPDVEFRTAVGERFGLTGGPVHGIAPVDFFMWPLRMMPVGRPSDYVRWPFKATWPDNGRARSAQLVDQWVEYARNLLDSDPAARVALVAMDPSDSPIAARIQRGLLPSERSVLLDCKRLNALEMSAALGHLRSITTSRYHAIIVPLAYTVPYIAVGHDTRSQFISEELGVKEYFLRYDTPELPRVLSERHAHLMEHRGEVRARLRAGFEQLHQRDGHNYELIRDVLERLGYQLEPEALATTPAATA
jgi:polysaccharide pyruvyl transferase WcaK-like protein